MHVNYFGTVRGRVGYDFGHTLVYFTGGFAYAGIDQRVDTASVSVPTLQIFRENNGVRTGFVLGGGIEYALDRSWSIKGEYQYLNLGSDSLTGEAVGLPVKIVTSTSSIDNIFHTLRLGINYRLY